jgi:hypothetical protein
MLASAALALLATNGARADIAWPSGLGELVLARMAATLPSGASAAFGPSAAFDSKGSIDYASSVFGDATSPLDTVASVTRFTAGENITTTPFATCLIVR